MLMQVSMSLSKETERGLDDGTSTVDRNMDSFLSLRFQTGSRALPAFSTKGTSSFLDGKATGE